MKRYEPRRFQLVGVELLHRLRRAWLADEPGLGKTAQGLLLFQRGGHERMVLICPASLRDHWCREAVRWIEERATRAGSKALRLPSRGLVVISYEGAVRHAEALVRWRPSLVLCDEAHYIKGVDSKRTAAVNRICRTVEHVALLTATPVVNHIAELAPQLQALRREDCVGGLRNFFNFYCGGAPDARGFGKPERLDMLNARLRASCLVRRRKEDVMEDMPRKIHEMLDVRIPSGTDYEPFLREASRCGDREAAMGYLAQARRALGSAKVPFAVSWAREQMLRHPDDKLVIAAHHQDTIVEIGRQLQCPTIYGGTPDYARQQIVDQFQENERHRCIVISMRTAGVGYTLTEANRLLFAELDWTPAAHEQTGDRIHRLGQEKDCHFSWLVARGTVEERVMTILRRKAEWFEASMNDRQVGGMVMDAIRGNYRRAS